jgi:Uma2 family endonuclease
VTNAWVNRERPLISKSGGLTAYASISQVEMNPMTMSRPYSAGEGVEEIWIATQGDIDMPLGKEMRKLPVGAAYRVPSTGITAHSKIDASGKPARLISIVSSPDARPVSGYNRNEMALQTATDIANMLPATFTAPGLSEREFLALCQEYPDCNLEYTAEGTVIIMPATDPKSAARVFEVGLQLGNWARQDGRGIVVGADALFYFPNGARRSPDAAWYDARRWQHAETPETRYPLFAPEFLIEVRSPDQRARPLREKMEEYMANGVQLGWLIDPLEGTVAIYRPGREPEVLSHPTEVAGEGPVASFVLKLDRIL